MGPSVEVVEPGKRRPDQPKQPLVDEKEPDDDVGHAQPMTPGSGIRGTIGAPKTILGPRPKAGAPSAADKSAKLAGDEDVFSWMQAGTPRDLGGFDYARIELTGVPGLDLQLEVLDGDGKRLVLANDGGPGEYEVIPNVGVDPAHTYYVRVREAGAPKGDPDHSYELTVATWNASANDEREPNDDATRATPIKLTSGTSGDASGFFGRKRDEDWLALPLAGVPAKDGRVTLRLEFAPPEGVTPSLKVLAPGAKEAVAEARGAKNDELRLRNVGVDATAAAVHVALRAVEGKSTEARWVLRVGLEPPLDGAEREPNNDVAHATPLPLSGGTAQIAGFLWPGDGDVYRVSGASPDAQLGFDVDGVDKVDLKLERLGADGKAWMRADDVSVGQGEILPPAKAGDGLVRVSARARDTAFDAPYRLTVTLVQPAPDDEREPNDGPATATQWQPGAAAMHGRLAPRGDEDWYSFTATAAPAGAHFNGPMPASVKIVDEGRRVIPPGTPLTAGQRYFVVIKAANDDSPGKADKPTRKANAEILKTAILDELKAAPQVTMAEDVAARWALDARHIDLSVVRMEVVQSGGYIEMQTELRLAISDDTGKMLSFLSGGAKVQVPKAKFNLNALPMMRKDALEGAMRGMFDKLLAHLRDHAAD